ncbi:hypothetical protein RHGRI_025734 [Rhododendron griersonianum]|uniref:Clp R domain-containing protein n=1 Tax=Rhododendron griersonianum TaxID=479676 RepID=A0AAV6IVM5_9ERIC|nr:hypothetical protein RHGRI_025734 [Rhododendron griersonianum]
MAELLKRSPPDVGLKFCSSLSTGSAGATPGSSGQLFSKSIVSASTCHKHLLTSPGNKESCKLIWEGAFHGKIINGRMSRYIPSTYGWLEKLWLEKLKQVASQDKCSGKVALEGDSIFSSFEDRGGEERVVIAAKGAAFLAYGSFSRICWTTHMEVVFAKDPDALYHVQWEVLKALMKLALVVYDLEDFIRIAYQEEMNAERLELRDLLSSYKVCVPLESGSRDAIFGCGYGSLDRLKLLWLTSIFKTADEAVLAIVDQEETMEDFCLLCESDVNDILEQRIIMADSDQKIHKDGRVSDVLVEWTIFLMKQYPPLKRDCALHIAMELARGKCCCIRETLLLESWGLSNFEHLNRLMPDVPFVELDNLTGEIDKAMIDLIEWKVLELGKSMKSATSPLRSSVFGTFTEEVIEVVEHADCERRVEGHRFIGTHHLLLGLVRTRIRQSVLMFAQLGHGCKEPTRYPASYIYRVARNIARCSGEDKIDLEHLFSAIMFTNLVTDELAYEIYEVLLSDVLSLRSKVLILGYICKDKVLGAAIPYPDCEVLKGFSTYSLAYGENEWNAELSGKRVDDFFDGVNKFIRREERLSTYCTVTRGRTVEGSVWKFVTCISRSWESTCNLLPILRENGAEQGSEEGEDGEATRSEYDVSGGLVLNVDR